MPESHSRPHSPPPSSVLTNPNRPMLVDVALPRHFYRVFTYLVPAHLQSLIRIGSRVRVPFGHATLHGMVVDLRPPSISAPGAKDPSLPSPPIRLREIDAIVDDAALETPAELMMLSRLVSEYYLAPWG